MAKENEGRPSLSEADYDTLVAARKSRRRRFRSRAAQEDFLQASGVVTAAMYGIEPHPYLLARALAVLARELGVWAAELEPVEPGTVSRETRDTIPEE